MTNNKLFLMRLREGRSFVIQARSKQELVRWIESDYREPQSLIQELTHGKPTNVLRLEELHHFCCRLVLTDEGDLQASLDGTQCVGEVLRSYPFLDEASTDEASENEQAGSVSMRTAVALERGELSSPRQTYR